jgi:hypothetical protein
MKPQITAAGKIRVTTIGFKKGLSKTGDNQCKGGVSKLLKRQERRTKEDKRRTISWR